MSSSDIVAINAWNNASSGINRYFAIIIFLFGTIGNILNTLVLSHRSLRRNPCSLCFLISSIANFIAIISGLTTRMLSGWTLDLTNTIDWLCKLRAFVLFFSRNIATWLIVLATIDRWLSSSRNARYRQLSTLKNAYYGIIFISILSCCLYLPIFYCYEANLINAPLKCYGKTEICRFSNDLIYAFITIILPIIIMFIFGFKTIINIHQVKRQIHTISIEIKPIGNSSVIEQSIGVSKKKLDHRLFFMLFIQIILLSIYTLPQAIQKIYSTLTVNQIQTPLTNAIINFIFNLVLLLTYFANGMPFYIYTLCGGVVFRNVLKALIQNISQKILAIFS